MELFDRTKEAVPAHRQQETAVYDMRYQNSVNVVAIGAPASGKTTLIGNILVHFKALDVKSHRLWTKLCLQETYLGKPRGHAEQDDDADVEIRPHALIHAPSPGASLSEVKVPDSAGPARARSESFSSVQVLTQHMKAMEMGDRSRDSSPGKRDGYGTPPRNKSPFLSGLPANKYVYLLDTGDEEKKQGRTSHCKICVQGASIGERTVTLIDVPGEINSLRHFISGVSCADFAILMIDVADLDHLGGPKLNVTSNLCQQMMISYACGIRRFIIAVNKIDAYPGYQEVFADKFFQFCDKVVRFAHKRLSANGVVQVHLIPISALEGHNLYTHSSITPWYTGPTLIELLNTIEMPPRYYRKSLRFVVQRVFKVADVGDIAFGPVKSGTLRVGQTVVVEPGGGTAKVMSIQHCRKSVDSASVGEIVGVRLQSAGPTPLALSSGMIIGLESDIKRPRTVTHFEAKILVLPGETAQIKVGWSPACYTHTGTIAVRLSKIFSAKTKGQEIHDPKTLTAPCTARVLFTVTGKPCCVEPFSTSHNLGNLVFVSGNRVLSAVGVVKFVAPFRDKLVRYLDVCAQKLPSALVGIVADFIDDKDVNNWFPQF